jgi:long-subunit acyl-CoA synthetase (AMP-forming)
MQVQIVKTPHNEEYEVLVDGSAAEGTSVLSSKYTSGELNVKGPNVFKGYWKNSKATQEVFTQDGWFKTGKATDLI